MRYIRIEDEGIFEIIRQDIENHCLVIKVNENRHDLIHESLGIKQADTIEELCDEFVCIGNGDFDLSGDKDIYGDLTEQMVDRYKIIYGAIWTDKGLIYVAKMNDKGELELI